MTTHQQRLKEVEERAAAYDAECLRGPMQPIYRFGDALIDETEISISDEHIDIPGFALGVDLRLKNRYEDMQ